MNPEEESAGSQYQSVFENASNKGNIRFRVYVWLFVEKRFPEYSGESVNGYLTPTRQRSRTRGAIYALRKERAISVPIQKAPDLLAKVGNTLSPPANPPPYDRSPATPEKAIPQKAVPPEDAPKPNVSDVDKIPLPMPGQWTLRHFLIVAGLVGILGVIGFAILRWRAMQPTSVSITKPVVRTVTETIAVTGRVAGNRETLVGTQNAGIIRELRVQSGDSVQKGDVIAKMESAVALSQLALAEKSLMIVRARQAEIMTGPRTSEVEAARARVSQADATVAESKAAISEALPTLPQARATVVQMQARRDLASRNRDRQQSLFSEGATTAVESEKATVEYTVAQADLTSAKLKVMGAQASIGAARSRADAASALARAVNAERRTIEAGPKPETVSVARRQVREAVEAVRVAQAQVGTRDVLAPFAGTITAVIAQVGASVGPGSGIVKLVQTGSPEIRMDVDESNLPQLRVGERVLISSAAYRKDSFEAKVSRIGVQVDEARGTVEVVVVALHPPLWIRPGQTLNVNIVTEEAVRRLFISTVALRSEGDRHYIIDATGGRARWQVVLPGEVAGDQVTILEGLRGSEQIVTDPKISFTAGAHLKIRRKAAKDIAP